MTERKTSFQDLLRTYVLKIGGLLKEELSDPRFEFGFRFLYPNVNGRLTMVIQPKGKDHVEISVGTPLSPPHREKFIALSDVDKRTFVKNLSKSLFQSEIDFTYEFSQHYTIVLIDKIFIEDNRISLNHFFNSVRKVYSKTMELIIFIQDFFSDEFSPVDFTIK